MSETERLVALRSLRSGEASARLVELAPRFGYVVGTAGPSTYRLARHRRRGLLRRMESATVQIFEDRNGTHARVVGPVEPALLELLAAGSEGTSTAASPAAPSVPAHPPVRPAPAQPTQPAARFAARPHAPVTPAPGVIAEVPGAASRVTERAVRPTVPNAHATPEAATLVRPTATRTWCLLLPDGRLVPLHRPQVLGRNPDPDRGPTGSERLQVDELSLSKSHVSIELRGDHLAVTDLHSTNGTAVVRDGRTRACEPGAPVLVPAAGTAITAGRLTVEVRPA